MARGLCLGDYLQLGSGELKSGGHRRESILADALEAIIGAVYLDQGIDQARRFVLQLLGKRLDKVSAKAALKDPKTRLQEYLQSRRSPLPVYEVLSIAGEAHAQTFVVSCRIAGLDTAIQGSGTSRRKAEQEAAQEALRLLGHE